jgi:hypothetical protein
VRRRGCSSENAGQDSGHVAGIEDGAGGAKQQKCRQEPKTSVGVRAHKGVKDEAGNTLETESGNRSEGQASR